MIAAIPTSGGTIIQPIRHPVMEKYFENDENTMASRLVDQADDAVIPVDPAGPPS